MTITKLNTSSRLYVVFDKEFGKIEDCLEKERGSYTFTPNCLWSMQIRKKDTGWLYPLQVFSHGQEGNFSNYCIWFMSSLGLLRNLEIRCFTLKKNMFSFISTKLLIGSWHRCTSPITSKKLLFCILFCFIISLFRFEPRQVFWFFFFFFVIWKFSTFGDIQRSCGVEGIVYLKHFGDCVKSDQQHRGNVSLD